MATTAVKLPDATTASSAEFAVLGSCLIPGEHEVLSYAINQVDEDHFIEAKNKMLFKVIKRMYQAGVAIDPTTIEGHMTAHEKKQISIAYIVDLAHNVPTALHVRHYHGIMRNRSLTIQLNKQYEKLMADPFNDETQKEVSRLWDRLNNSGHSVVSLKDATLKYSDTLDRRRTGREFRIITGYSHLDDKLGGFFGGNLIAVGARTSLGKTSLLLNIALRFLKQNLRILFVSAEMITDEILDRMVAMEADLPISKLRKGHIYDDDLKRVTDNLAKFHELPMWFLEGGKMSLARLRTAIDATNPAVIFVDFIQRFVPPNPAMNRAAYFSDLVNEFKAVAMEKKMVVIAASQLNRDVEKDGTRAPQLSDFKESGGIEEACDIAMLLQGKKPTKGDDPKFIDTFKKITVHICKHRNGPTGQVPFIFQKARTMFFEEEEAPPML